jgi:hypothetical protein
MIRFGFWLNCAVLVVLHESLVALWVRWKYNMNLIMTKLIGLMVTWIASLNSGNP